MSITNIIEKKVLGFECSPDMLILINIYCEARGITNYSEAIRQLVSVGLDESGISNEYYELDDFYAD